MTYVNWHFGMCVCVFISVYILFFLYFIQFFVKGTSDIFLFLSKSCLLSIVSLLLLESLFVVIVSSDALTFSFSFFSLSQCIVIFQLDFYSFIKRSMHPENEKLIVRRVLNEIAPILWIFDLVFVVVVWNEGKKCQKTTSIFQISLSSHFHIVRVQATPANWNLSLIVWNKSIHFIFFFVHIHRSSCTAMIYCKWNGSEQQIQRRKNKGKLAFFSSVSWLL